MSFLYLTTEKNHPVAETAINPRKIVSIFSLIFFATVILHPLTEQSLTVCSHWQCSFVIEFLSFSSWSHIVRKLRDFRKEYTKF